MPQAIAQDSRSHRKHVSASVLTVLALVAISIALVVGSNSATSAPRTQSVRTSALAIVTNRTKVETDQRDWLLAASGLSAPSDSPFALSSSTAMEPVAPVFLPSLQTFASNCATPKTDFNVGDTVCVKSTGTTAGNKIEWIDACSDSPIKTTTVTTDPQTDTFTLPASGVATGAGACDGRGDWQVEEFTSSNNFQGEALFRVHDPAHTASNLTITASGNVTQPNVDNAILFFATNKGPDDAANAQVTFTVPTNMTFGSFAGAVGWTCPSSPTNGTITCTRATFPAQALGANTGDIFTLHATTPATAAQSEIFTSVGTITSNTQELNPPDNSTVVDLTVNSGGSTGPSINRGSGNVTSESCVQPGSLTFDTGQIDPGDTVTVSFTIINNSLTAAGDVTGLVGTLRNTGGVTSPSGTLNFGNVAHNSTKAASVSFTAANVDCGSGLVASIDMTDSASHNLGTVVFRAPMGKLVGSGGNDDIFSCCATVPATNADLQVVSNLDAPDPVSAGNNITYTISVTNNGADAAQSVSLTDTVPANTTFVSFVAPDGWTPTTPAVGGTGNVTATIATFASGATAQFTLVAKVNNAATDGSTITDTATIASSTTDPTPSNNAATTTTTIGGNADLSVTKSGSPSAVPPGGNITYSITVNNAGPGTAQSVSLADNVPANTTFVSETQNNGPAFSCTNPPVGGTGAINCTISSLASGATANFSLVVKVNSSPSITSISNNATVSSGTSDPSLDNNSATATTSVSTFSINDVSVLEGNSGSTNAVFTVTLSSPLTSTTTVDFATANGTATAPVDYTATNGTLTFTAGSTTKTINVPVVGNTTPEANEIFFVNLQNPGGTFISKAQGTGTILDDDATSSFQFSSAAVAANENDGSVTLNVTRTGDTSGGASVAFETSDGTAVQKSDYTFGSGVVQFAAGETSKTINILLVNDNLVEGNETFIVTLLNPSGNSVVGSPGSVIVSINDDDFTASASNPIDNATFFVRQHYLDFLGREPDSTGLNFWVNQMTNCGNPDPQVCRINVSAAFFLSIEFQDTGGFVVRLQRAAFGRRSADPGTRVPYLKFVRDVRAVAAGVVVGQSGFDTRLEANKQAYATQVVSDPLFAALFPQSTAAAYVDALFASAGVTPTSSERTAAINAFGSGGTAGRVAALRSVADSDAIREAELIPFFVLSEYYGYLRRNPTDSPDFSDAGYQFWLSKLNSFGGDFVKAEMVKAFLGSAEYRSRFGQP